MNNEEKSLEKQENNIEEKGPVKKELENSFVKLTLILSIVALFSTFIEINIVIISFDLIISIVVIVMSLINLKNGYKKTGTITFLISIICLLISLVFLWMNIL